jgi:ATPase subunit of ABC transporter with duplicated ATPase domains
VSGLDAPVLVASHDRGLIHDVATTVVELDIRQARVGVYPGGWSDYEQARDLVRRASWEDYERYADQRDALTEQARRRTDWASKGARAARRSDEPDKHLRHRKVARAQALDQRDPVVATDLDGDGAEGEPAAPSSAWSRWTSHARSGSCATASARPTRPRRWSWA